VERVDKRKEKGGCRANPGLKAQFAPHVCCIGSHELDFACTQQQTVILFTIVLKQWIDGQKVSEDIILNFVGKITNFKLFFQ